MSTSLNDNSNGHFSEWRRLILDKLGTNTEGIKELDKELNDFKLEVVRQTEKIKGEVKAQKRSAATWAVTGASITTGVLGLVYLLLRLTNLL